MGQQKSERRIRPQARRKPGPTRRVEYSGGGKAAPVNEQTWQLGLRFGTAENPVGPSIGVVGGVEADRSAPAPCAAPKPKRKKKTATSAAMEHSPPRCSSGSHWDRRGREPTRRGGHNPRCRRAGCEQHSSGSVRGAQGDRGAYSMEPHDEIAHAPRGSLGRRASLGMTRIQTDPLPTGTPLR